MNIIRHHHKAIDSTNSWAKHNAHLFDRDKITLVTADGQTAGRGRFKRKWESPTGFNIYATFCFFLKKHRSDIGNIPQILALATLEVLKELGFHPKLKWPNDILLSQKKVGGILAETTSVEDQPFVIIGLGLNVNMPKEILAEIGRPATSLFVEDGKFRDLESILLSLQQTFAIHLQTFIDQGFIKFLDSYRAHISHLVGDLIRFHDNQNIQEGIFQEITSDGALVLLLNSSERKIYRAGEILQ